MASITKRPNGRWQAQVRTNGRSVSKTFAARRDAVAWARSIETDLDRGDRPSDGRRLKELALRDILVRYRDEVIPRKQAGHNEACVLGSILRDDARLCATRLDAVTSTQFAEWRDRRLKRMKPASVCRYLGVMQHAIDVAMRDWGVPMRENPLRQVRRPVVRNRRERRITGRERSALLDAASHYVNPLMQPLIALALETGMRRGELLSIRWIDFDSTLRVLRLRTSKNGHARTVPLSPEAVRILSALRGTGCTP